MPTQPVLDIMRRTMANLAFVEAKAGPNGPYEVTQLINSFLGALAHPWEAVRKDLMNLAVSEAHSRGWPLIQKERPTDYEPRSLGDLVRLMRNGVAHGHIEFIPDKVAQIYSVRVWNDNPPGRRTWGAIIYVDDMRRFLKLFVELIEDRHKKFGWL